MTIPLPPCPKIVTNNAYRLSDYIGKTDEYIKASINSTIALNYNTLTENFDLLEHILSIKPIDKISCYDYESALLLDSLLKTKINLNIVDDYQNKDRSYICMSMFENQKVSVPLSYIMWGVKFKDSCNIRCFRYGSNDNMFSANGDNVISKDTKEKVLEIIKELNIGSDELEKILLVSNYLESKVQYVEDGNTTVGRVTYIPCEPKERISREKVGSLETVINESYGLCMGIANTTTLLLNNPIMNINARSLFGSSHVWNLVKVGNVFYHLDNTWAITRNKSKLDYALKALDFDDTYLLFGNQSALEMEHHTANTYLPNNISDTDYDKDIIKEKVLKLSSKVSFNNYSRYTPVDTIKKEN